METDTHPTLVFHNVSKNDTERLRKYIENERGTHPCGNSGYAETPCFSAKYDYSPDDCILRIEPVILMPGLRSKRLERIIQAVIAPRETAFVSAVTGETIYKPIPHACASYNWVVGFMTNNSGGPLTLGLHPTDHGTIISATGSIPSGSRPVDQDPDDDDKGKAGVFQNMGAKDSGLGCFGSINWQLSDNATILTLYYGVNTLSAVSATTSLTGPAASSYSASVDLETHFYYACAYLYPYVTINKVT